MTISINQDAISSISSPLTLFALVVLVCNTVFAFCAAWLKKEQPFIYTLHMFMGIVFFIGTIVLWAPGFLYHPREVEGLHLSNEPWVPTIVSVIGVIIYMAYQLYKGKRNLRDADSAKSVDTDDASRNKN